MADEVEFTLEQTAPRSYIVHAHLNMNPAKRVPVGEVHDSFGSVVAKVWGANPRPVTFGNVDDAASWVVKAASQSGSVLL